LLACVRDMCVLCIFLLHKGASAYCTCTYGRFSPPLRKLSSILTWYQSIPVQGGASTAQVGVLVMLIELPNLYKIMCDYPY
jgi:hypothetical protein